MGAKLVTIVPFYQTEREILRRSITSALKQKGVAPFEIVIVDDGSPVKASVDIKDLLEGHPGRIRIIEKSNGGVGAARNTGLDSLAADVEYVAFLDSDDEWMEDHIHNAIVALELGYDFYFADYLAVDRQTSAFNSLKRVQAHEHRKLPVPEPVYEFTRDLFDLVVRHNVVILSSNVYRFSKFRQLRFREHFRNAGEDYLFWCEIGRATNKIVFSAEVEHRRGSGINIYSGAMKWGSEKYLNVICDEVQYRKEILREMSPNDIQIARLKDKIMESRIMFTRGLIHDLHVRHRVRWSMIGQMLRNDPLYSVQIFPILFQILADKLRGMKREPA
jgi:succinoglycan biosynthesis protein ExoW